MSTTGQTARFHAGGGISTADGLQTAGQSMHFWEAIQVSLLDFTGYHIVHIPNVITSRFEDNGFSYLGEQLKLLCGVIHDLGLRLVWINGTLSADS